MLLGIQGSGQLTDDSARPGSLPRRGRAGRGARLSTRSGPASTSRSTTRSSTSVSRWRRSPPSPSASCIGAGVVLLPLRHPEPRGEAGGVARLPVARDGSSSGSAWAARGRRTSRRRASRSRSAVRAPTRASRRCERCSPSGPRRSADASTASTVSPSRPLPRPGRPADPRRRPSRGCAAPRRKAGGRLAAVPRLAAPFRGRLEVVRTHALAAGRDPEALAGTCSSAFARVDDDGERAREAPGSTSRSATGCASSRLPRRAPLHRGHTGGVRRAHPRLRRGGRRAHLVQPGRRDDGLLEQVARLRAVAHAGRRRHDAPAGRRPHPRVEQFGAGPWGTLQLADLGAEVIKIEDPSAGGDVGRYVPPFQEGEDSLFFETFNRGKKSVSLDLRHPGARDVLHDLVRVSDGVYSNLRGDQPAQARAHLRAPARTSTRGSSAARCPASA